MSSRDESSVKAGLQASVISIALNIFLAVIKVVTGILGNSNALIADGIESSADVITSVIVWSGLRISTRPADDNHPFGHGKAESLTSIFVCLALLGAALTITVQSVHGLSTPQAVPEWYTLLILVLIILSKEAMFRYAFRIGESLNSSALKSDAWHHRSDMLTSLAALIGISVAVIGGEKYAKADEWAALIACVFIYYNGFRLLKPALDEIMDAAVPEEIEEGVRKTAMSVSGVQRIGKCRTRKSGMGLLVDIHIKVDGDISVSRGHAIAHDVKDALQKSDAYIIDVSLHVEPE